MTTKTIKRKSKVCECKNHSHCLHCDRKLARSEETGNGYCLGCWRSSIEDGLVLKGSKNCIVLGCDNNSRDGSFVGDLCAPCHTFITTGDGQYSQAYRNSLQIIVRRCKLVEERGIVQALDPTRSIGKRGVYLSDDDLTKITQ